MRSSTERAVAARSRIRSSSAVAMGPQSNELTILVKSSFMVGFGRLWAVRAASDPATLPSKGERTRLALLDRAVHRFAADGYRATSLADIARDANVTPAAAYVYFASKEALFTEAADTDAAGLITDALTPT